MRKKLLALAAAVALVAATVTACDGSGTDDASGRGSATAAPGKARVGVILPDTTTSTRWVTADARYLQEAFEAIGVPVEIKNAMGDRENFLRIGQTMINTGVRVLMIVNLDSVSGKTLIDRARASNIPTIDYERLTVNGGANYYVSFDNEQVGRLQGEGLVKCLKARKAVNPVVAELNGSPTDSNATLFKAGYDSILQPKFDSAEYTKGPDQSVPDWSTDEGGKIFAQMLRQQPKIKGVLAANDGLAGAVIKVLRSKGLNGKVQVTGQDATVEGLQALLTGELCVTVYKRIKPQAQTAAGLAAQLFKGRKPGVGSQIQDPESGGYLPFAKLQPEAIDVTKVKDVVADGFVTKNELCTAKYAALCARYGVE